MSALQRHAAFAGPVTHTPEAWDRLAPRQKGLRIPLRADLSRTLFLAIDRDEDSGGGKHSAGYKSARHRR